MISGTRQLAQFLKYIRKTVSKLTNNKAHGHYREMAWLPFQKHCLNKPISPFLEANVKNLKGRQSHPPEHFKGESTVYVEFLENHFEIS